MRILPLIFILLAGFQVDSAYGQYYGKKKKKKKKKPTTEKVERTRTSPDSKSSRETAKFTDKLWYGGGANIGFDGNNALSLFNIGLTPMVGYKITEMFSVGPRIGFNYSYIKGTGTDFNIKKVQTFSPEYGAFARFKFLPFLFAHADFNRTTVEFPDFTNQLLIRTDVDGNALTIKESANEINVGLGYTSGDVLGYEILLLYDVLADNTATLGLPFKFRFGFNYKF